MRKKRGKGERGGRKERKGGRGREKGVIRKENTN
jgi:hypothetical protein